MTRAARPGASITLLCNPSTVAANGVVYLMVTATATNGTTPAGSVSFSIDGNLLGSAVLSGSAGTATATLVVNASQLPMGTGVLFLASDESSYITGIDLPVDGGIVAV